MTSTWISLKALPKCSYLSPPCIINGQSTILFSANTNYMLLNVLKDDSYPEQKRIEYPRHTNLNGHATCYDSRNGLLYIYVGRNNACLLILNVKTLEWVTANITRNRKQYRNIRNRMNVKVKKVGHYSRMLIDPQQRLHLIGGSLSNEHLIYNSRSGVFESNFRFPYQCLYGFGVCHSAMNNELILFGGKGDSSHTRLNAIWTYDLELNNNNRWIKKSHFELKIALSSFGYVIVDHLNIVLIFGGRDNNNNKTDLIFILDLNANSCVKLTHIKCPNKSTYYALIVAASNLKKSNSNSNSDSNSDSFYVHLIDYENNNNNMPHFVLDLYSILPFKYKQMSEVKPESESEMRLNLLQEDKFDSHNILAQLQQSNVNQANELITKNEDLAVALKQIELLRQKSSEMRPHLMPGAEQQSEMKSQEQLTDKEMSFKQFLYANLSCAEKYYQSFVENTFNDLEMLMEFEMDDISILESDLQMHKIHARLLMKKIIKLKKDNQVFEQWFSDNEIRSECYDAMIIHGVYTMGMLGKRIGDTNTLQNLFNLIGNNNNAQEVNTIWGKLSERNIGVKQKQKPQKQNINNNANAVAGECGQGTGYDYEQESEYI